jgi:hypothetical protein
LIEPFSEKYLKKLMKKLIGNNDIEDALKRLDRLTQEEARMASAQLLKITNAIDSEVREIADNVLFIDDRVAGVDERVVGVDERLAGVDERVVGVGELVTGVDDRVAGVDERVDRMERSWFRTAFMLDVHAQSSSQGINYDRIFVDGSRHKIHLRITISRATPITRERRPGFLKERPIRNGGQHWQVPSPYSGFMENVRPVLPPAAI